MKIIPFFGDGYASNSYLAVNEEAGEAVLFDAAVSPDLLRITLEAESAKLTAIVLTHGHFDHILELAPLRAVAPVMIHVYDGPCLTNASRSEFLSFLGRNVVFAPADRLLSDGDLISCGAESFRVIHTPGHTPGSCCFLAGDGTALISGDTLFAGSVGRTDLTGGDYGEIMKSFKKLALLPKDLTVYPGHGPATTLDRELKTNPYLRGV